MKIPRRQFILQLAAGAAALPSVFGITGAQSYPGKLIKIIAPVPAGSPLDAMARLMASALTVRLAQTVIVENRPGGGTAIGTRAVATAVPDGYTLLAVGLNHVFGPSISKTLGYDPLKDFAPIAIVGTGSYVLVVAPSVPARSVKELIKYTKANPGKLNWGFGQATGPHLFGELFRVATGIDVNKIPYKGGTEAVPDLLGDRIQMNFGVIANFLPLIREEKLRALAIGSDTRSLDLPDVPTMIECGLPQLTRGYWSGLAAPAGTRAEIVNRLNAEINAGLATPEMKASPMKLGYEPRTGSPQDFAALLANEIEAWGAAAKLAGIVAQ
jgi:tripartite-type tricarboxylate transporter receptor subunit TctC